MVTVGAAVAATGDWGVASCHAILLSVLQAQGAMPSSIFEVYGAGTDKLVLAISTCSGYNNS